jgi:hypothetical protein
MRFSRHFTRCTARLALAALLWALGLQLVQACAIEASQPAMAFTAAGECEMQGAHKPVSPNACLNQCLQPDQSSAAYHVNVPPPLDTVVLLLPVDCVALRALDAPVFSQVPQYRGPPSSIEFSSLRL